MIRTAKVIESKIKIRRCSSGTSSLHGVFMMRLVQTSKAVRHSRHPCSTVHASITNCRVPCVGIQLAEQEDQEGCLQQFGCRDMQHVDLPGASRLDAHNVGTYDPW